MEIHWTNLDGLGEKDRQSAEVRFRKLVERHNDLIDLRVTGKKNGHRAQDSEEVRIACQARGREIVAARSADQVGRALHDAMVAPPSVFVVAPRILMHQGSCVRKFQTGNPSLRYSTESLMGLLTRSTPHPETLPALT